MSESNDIDYQKLISEKNEEFYAIREKCKELNDRLGKLHDKMLKQDSTFTAKVVELQQSVEKVRAENEKYAQEYDSLARDHDQVVNEFAKYKLENPVDPAVEAGLLAEKHVEQVRRILKEEADRSRNTAVEVDRNRDRN